MPFVLLQCGRRRKRRRRIKGCWEKKKNIFEKRRLLLDWRGGVDFHNLQRFIFCAVLQPLSPVVPSESCTGCIGSSHRHHDTFLLPSNRSSTFIEQRLSVFEAESVILGLWESPANQEVPGTQERWTKTRHRNETNTITEREKPRVSTPAADSFAVVVSPATSQ